jgi:molybdate transport system regulatory protein
MARKNLKLRVKSKFWIEDEQGRPVFGAGRSEILQKIDELGTIKAAAEDLNMSYRAVWGKIKAAEERLGVKLVETNVGGGKRGGAVLTEPARELLKRFDELHERGASAADQLFKAILGERLF